MTRIVIVLSDYFKYTKKEYEKGKIILYTPVYCYLYFCMFIVSIKLKFVIWCDHFNISQLSAKLTSIAGCDKKQRRPYIENVSINVFN